MKSVKRSLEQMLGKEFTEAVVRGAVALGGLDDMTAERLAKEEVEFLPEAFIKRVDSFLEKVGQKIVPPLPSPIPGAPTDSFRKATSTKSSPIGGLGYYRLGEDGRLYLIAKSEHYHAPLGHSFLGFKLLENAKALGITNATHNNTRGYITRLLEMEIVRTANGIGRGDTSALQAVLDSREPHVLNRVINLETGSLGCEAGIKMMLARFYRLDSNFPEPRYKGRIPVFFIMADHEGGGKANYHGTTVIAQTMRDLWPEISEKMRDAGIMKVCPVNINDFEDFRTKFEQYNKPPYKAAGFLHEIILMNYGGIKLEEDYLKKVYELCHANDTPVLCDEIQSCMWYPGMYLFRLYGLNPDFVVIGKGFPGGQYAASKIITTAEMDSLNQFGALVTNGQEELASLSYLITMEFAQENAEYIKEIGEYYQTKVRRLASCYPSIIDRVEGKGHLLAIFFYDVEMLLKFTHGLNDAGIDISAQTYKAKCPPAALTKPPIISTPAMIDYFTGRMEEILNGLK